MVLVNHYKSDIYGLEESGQLFLDLDCESGHIVLRSRFCSDLFSVSGVLIHCLRLLHSRTSQPFTKFIVYH